MSEITLQNVTKRFGEVTALDDVSITVKDGEFFVLLGPTGAGKTTTLRVIAGLEQHEAGRVTFDGEDMTSVTPAERDVAFVFQQYSLYPNMTVYENLAFPLRSPMRRQTKQQIDKKIREVAATLRIGHLLDRKTAKLSGGEMQRVSIGRAIVREPRVFLMDEPLSNLDAKLREALRVELQHLQKTQGSTTVFVTHDQIEALTMADRLAVLDAGRILQIGTPHDIYDRPATTYVAQLVGTPRINLVAATRQNGHLVVDGSELILDLPPGKTISESCMLGIRPEDVHIRGEGRFQGQVVLTEPLGVETIVHIQTQHKTMHSIVSGQVPYGIGTPVNFDIVPDRLHVFDTTGLRI